MPVAHTPSSGCWSLTLPRSYRAGNFR
jgi:hypothetical protein